LRHPNIVESLRAFIFSGKTHVVLELCANGSLLDRRLDGPVAKPLASKWIIQVAGALKFLHSRGVAHGDVKPDNILLDNKGNAKLSDFSHAAYLEKDGSAKMGGSLRYMAPETILSGRGRCQSDIWNLGASL
jgi:serine/threonine protein kinase